MIRESFLGALLLFGTTVVCGKDAPVRDICAANFLGLMSGDDAAPTSFVTWASVPVADAHKTIAQFKTIAVAPEHGFEVGAENYYGPRGTLVLTKPLAAGQLGTDNLQSFSMEVSVDQGLGTISLAMTHLSGKLLPFQAAFEGGMCGLLTDVVEGKTKSSSGSSAPANAQRFHFKNPFAGLSLKSPKQRMAGQVSLSIDQLKGLLQRALPAGKAVVIMPTLSPVFGLTSSQIQLDKRGTYLANLSSRTMWQGPGESPTTLISAGYQDDAHSVGLQGYLWASGHGPKVYMLYIVEPGTYTLVGASVDGFKVKMPGLGAAAASAKSSVGTVRMKFKQFTEGTIGTAHADPTYQARTVQTCTLAVGGENGPCVQTADSTVYDQTSAGGDYQTTFGTPTFGVNASAKLSKGFASFSVAAGEAVVVDGFFAGYPDAEISQGSCRPNEESAHDKASANRTMNCAIKQLVLLRLPATRDELLESAREDGVGLQELLAIFDRVKERALTIAATPSTEVPGLGTMYSLRSGK